MLVVMCNMLMNRLALFLAIFVPSFVYGGTLAEKDLVGEWTPSGEYPYTEEITLYRLSISKDFSVQYIPIKEGFKPLTCQYKASETQNSVFVFYCYIRDIHAITLSLAGWESSSGSAQLIYGHEYWLGYPNPGEIYGGIPVSYKKHITKKGNG